MTTCSLHIDSSYLHNPQTLFKQLAWKHLFQKVTITTTPETEHLLPLLQKTIDEIHMVASDYRDLRAQTTKNLLALVKTPREITLGNQLSFPHHAAIICGGGLNEQEIATLRNYQNQALIIACGSAFPKLLHAGISPTFFACIDSKPDFDPIITQNKTPLLFQERTCQKHFQALAGPKIHMGSASSFPLDHHLFPTYHFDAGWGAATFGAACAKLWECPQIALCGISDSGRDRALSKSWMEKLQPVPLEKIAPKPFPEHTFFTIQTTPPDLLPLQNEITHLLSLQKEPRPIFEAELTTSILSELIFDPIWLIYKHLFARERGDLATHKFLFYQRLLKTYQEILC
ncbi:MAG: hypothetical protein ChlgKO_10990 [Chlamydiales bacterium]